MRRQHSLLYTITTTILMTGLVISKVPPSSLSLLAFLFIGPLLILFIICGMRSRSPQERKVSDCSATCVRSPVTC